MSEATRILYGPARDNRKMKQLRSRVRALIASGELHVAKLVNGKQLFDRSELVALRDRFAGSLRGLAKTHVDDDAAPGPSLAELDEGRALREANAELERQRAEQLRAMRRSGS